MAQVSPSKPELEVSGVEHAVAEELVSKAHRNCPYSNVVQGNVGVTLMVK